MFLSTNDIGEKRFKIAQQVVDGNIDDCLEYDLRRLWIEDELKGE